MAQIFTQQNFETEVLKSDLPVLVDFFADWCGPCKMIAPIIDELSVEYDGKAIIGKVNVDENNELAAQYGVMSIPTIVILKNGKVEQTLNGIQSKIDLTKALDQII